MIARVGFCAVLLGAAIARADDGGAPAATDVPTVSARLDKSEAHVGDEIVLSVTAVTRKGVPVNLPSALDLAPFAILDRSESEHDLGNGRLRREFVLKIAVYETGDLAVPAIDITYLDSAGKVKSARTDKLPVRVASLLANEPDAKLKETVEPLVVTEEVRWPVYAAGAFSAASAGAALALILRRRWRQRASRRPAPPPRPAHEIALEKLDRLGAAGFADDGDHRPFVFAVSEVLREYLGARFGFDALEMTTDELSGELERRAQEAIVLGEVTGWLAECDLVKFAKAAPSAERARGLLETAVRIVESTRVRQAPPPPAVQGAA